MHVIKKSKPKRHFKSKIKKSAAQLNAPIKKQGVTELINKKLKNKELDNINNLCLVELLQQLDSDQLDVCIVYAEYNKAYKASEMLKQKQIPSETLCKSLVRVFNRLDKLKLKNRLSFSSYLNAIRILEEGSIEFN